MFLKLFIAVYTPQHTTATINALEQAGYGRNIDYRLIIGEEATHITTTDNGTYTVWTLDRDVWRNDAKQHGCRIINTRQVRGVHRRLRTSFSQDNQSKLEIVPVRPVNIFPELEKLSLEESRRMQAAIKWTAPRVPTPDVYFKLWYNTAISWTKAIVKRLVRHFK